MTEDLYFTIAAYIAGAAFSIWMIPVVYFLILKASHFINDKKTNWQDADDPSRRTCKKFWVFDDELIPHALIGVVVVLGTLLIWPVVVFAGAVIACLLFMRMSSRLKRHMKDKEAHR